MAEIARSESSPYFRIQQKTRERKRFFVVLAGETNDAHHDFVKKLEAVGQTEASSPEGCDYVVCFCPVASRVGTDVNAALNKIPADKPSILVVMHHTFNPDHVVAESRRLVTKSNVHLTLDCLFHEGQFLKCERNDAAWDEVQKYLRFPLSLRQVIRSYSTHVLVCILACGLCFRYRNYFFYAYRYVMNIMSWI